MLFSSVHHKGAMRYERIDCSDCWSSYFIRVGQCILDGTALASMGNEKLYPRWSKCCSSLKIRSGIYTIPNSGPDLYKDKEKYSTWEAQAKEGPYAFITVRANGLAWDMKTSLGIMFAMQFILAIVAGWLICNSKFQSAYGRAFFVAIAMTAGVTISSIGGWNWSGFPLVPMLVCMADAFIGWFLAGLVMGKVLR
jgi:hypothetical protein